jgi:tetratricopeptide (TPR) repeat protein
MTAFPMQSGILKRSLKKWQCNAGASHGRLERSRIRPRALPATAFCFLAVAGFHIGVAQTSGTGDQLKLARSYDDQGKYSEAETILRSYIADNKTGADAVYLLAYTLFRENKPADSLKQYTEAAQLRTPKPEDLRTVALDYVLLNDYRDAEHWAKYALSLDQKDAETWYELGRIEYTLNRFQDSLTSFHRSLALDPSSVKAENNLGLALEGLNRTDEAMAAYRKALAMQASSPHPSEQPMLNLATLLVSGDQFDEALPLLEQAQRIAPRDWKILAQLGRLHLDQGNLSDAQHDLEQAIEIQPERASLHFQLGQTYKKQGASDKANAQFALVQQLLKDRSSPDR